LRKKEKQPSVDVRQLPDYMQMRQKRIDEKKRKEVRYTLEITQNLPKPNFKAVKSKLVHPVLPDAIESSLQS